MSLADSVYTLNVNLLRRFVRYKMLVMPLHGFTYGSRIAGIILCAKKICFHITRMNTANFVTKAFNGSGPVFRGCASLHTHRHCGRLTKKRITPARVNVRLTTGLPLPSTSQTEKLFFARSMSIVITVFVGWRIGFTIPSAYPLLEGEAIPSNKKLVAEI